MAQPTHSRRLQLPTGSIPYARALLRGEEVSLYHAHQPPIELPAHSHDQGQVSFLIEPASCRLKWPEAKGDWTEQALHGPHVYFVAPGQEHTSRWETEAELLEIYCEPDALRRIARRKLTGVILADAASAAGRDFVVWQLVSLLRHLGDEPTPDMELVEHIALGLVARVVKLLTAKPAASVAVQGPVLSRDQVRRIHEYVRKNLPWEIHVADLAKLMDRSVAHFTEVFKNTTGTNPYEFITECRMLKAHELLFAGGQTLGKVSRAVGFQDQGYFSRKFRDFFGYGPRFLLRHTRPDAKRPKKSEKPQ
jgi:AraC family transcriptional regulator